MNGLADFQYYLPTRIVFGCGSAAKAGEEAARLGTKALVVAAAGSMRQLGYIDLVAKSLAANGISYEIFDEVQSNPDTDTVAKGAGLMRETGCDLTVGLGGGSAIDAAKAVAAAAGLNRPILELMRDGLPGRGYPCLAMPTTAGTGAEVTHISVLTIKENSRKDALRGPHNYAAAAIVDPALTLGLPPYFTASTGMDALTHAIEAFTSRTAQVYSDGYARRAIELAAVHLRRAVFHGDDLEARTGMALASNLAGAAISQAGTAAAHGIGMTVGGVCNTDHGVTVGLALPAAMAFNLPTNLAKYAEVARLMGVDTTGLGMRKAAEAAVEAVRELLGDLGLPKRLSELGVTHEYLPRLLSDTRTQRVWLNNPRPVSEEEMESLFREVL